MCATSKPLEVRFHAFLVALLTTRKCHNSLENHGRNEHHTFFIFTPTKAFWSSCLEREHHWSSHGAVAVTTASTKLRPQGFNNSQSNALHMTLLYPPHPPSVNNNDTCNVTKPSTKQRPQGFNKSQSNDLSTWRYCTPTPPHPPSLYHDFYSTWQDWGFLEAPGNPQPWSFIYCIYIYIYIYIYIHI